MVQLACWNCAFEVPGPALAQHPSCHCACLDLPKTAIDRDRLALPVMAREKTLKISPKSFLHHHPSSLLHPFGLSGQAAQCATWKPAAKAFLEQRMGCNHGKWSCQAGFNPHPWLAHNPQNHRRESLIGDARGYIMSRFLLCSYMRVNQDYFCCSDLFYVFCQCGLSVRVVLCFLSCH